MACAHACTQMHGVQIKRLYWPALEELIKRETKASRVLVFDHTQRQACGWQCHDEACWAGMDRALLLQEGQRARWH